VLTPMQHQLDAVNIAKQHPRYAFFWDCGTGKTIAMLMVCEKLGGRTLVLAPKSILRAAWAEDAKLFPDLRVTIAWSTKKTERLKLIHDPEADIVVTNYETFKRNYREFLASGFQRLIVDESSKLKCPDTQITKSVHLFCECETTKSVYLLSGTPAPNNPTEYWGQLKCLYPTLAPYYKFCYSYFKPLKRKYGEKTFTIGWDYLENKKDAFLDGLKKCSWSMSKEEAVDLPAQTDEIRDVTLSKDERTAYETMRKQLIVQFNNGELVGATTQSRLIKLRQLTGGLMYHGEDRVSETGSSKINELLAVLAEIGDKQVVIWAEFTADIDRIHSNLSQLGDTAIIDGRTKDAGNIVSSFQGGFWKYLICQPQAAGHGITLTAASYAIYYNTGFSYENHKQSRDRIHRKGQHDPCTYYYLVASDTCDWPILQTLRNKQSVSENTMEILGIKQGSEKQCSGTNIETNCGNPA